MSQVKAKYRWYWPELKTIEDTKAPILGGVIACSLIVTVTLLLVAFKVTEPGAIFDAFLFTALGVGTFFKSRFAAVSASALFVLEKIYLWSVAGVQGFPLAVALLVVFISAARGTYAYHRFMKAPPPTDLSGDQDSQFDRVA